MEFAVCGIHGVWALRVIGVLSGGSHCAHDSWCVEEPMGGSTLLASVMNCLKSSALVNASQSQQLANISISFSESYFAD